MMKYEYSMAKMPGRVFVIVSPNWKMACAAIKASDPDCGYIKYISGVKNHVPYDDGDFDDAGRIGKESYSWRNRKSYR
jgi:hypothetical protein